MSVAPEIVPTGNTYDKYASSNPIERRMMAGFFSSFDRFVDAAAPARVLEVGAGEGLVARRIVSRVQEGHALLKGERYGLIRFGSRVDVYLPPGSTIGVKVGEKVSAGTTTLALLGPVPTTRHEARELVAVEA